MSKKEDTNKFGICLGEKIRRIRETENLSMEELAVQTGIPKNRILRWENGGGVRLPVVELVQIAKALNMDLDYFLDECPKGSG